MAKTNKAMFFHIVSCQEVAVILNSLSHGCHQTPGLFSLHTLPSPSRPWTFLMSAEHNHKVAARIPPIVSTFRERGQCQQYVCSFLLKEEKNSPGSSWQHYSYFLLARTLSRGQTLRQRGKKINTPSSSLYSGWRQKRGQGCLFYKSTHMFCCISQLNN